MLLAEGCLSSGELEFSWLSLQLWSHHHYSGLFALLLQIVKPFPSNGTSAESQEAKVAELVLKCVWKLARNIPQDLEKQVLDPVELFPAIEHFLQSIPPNEWRARATNKVPCGDMPLRTIKVIIQHVVGKCSWFLL